MTAIPQQLDELLGEAEEVFLVAMLAIAKQTHLDTGDWDGTFPCPRCHYGTVAWAVAKYNGHTSILCSTTYTGDDGETYRCTSAME